MGCPRLGKTFARLGAGAELQTPLLPSVLSARMANGPTDPKMFLLKTRSFRVKNTDTGNYCLIG